MKKLSLLICTLFLLSPLASHASCPLTNSATPCPIKASPCEKAKPNCGCGKTDCGCDKPKQCEPCKKSDCGCPKEKCSKTDKYCDKKNCCDSVVKQESPCWGMSQQELFKCLGLDQCQMQKACCLYQQYLDDTQTMRAKLKCEEDRLCKSTCLSVADKKQAKKNIKELRNEIKDRWNDYDEQFRYLLCKDQLKKYKKINKDQKKNYKSLKKNNCCTPKPKCCD